jgi:beta-lactamase regulating signal transducer with metallopeptidase domain
MTSEILGRLWAGLGLHLWQTTLVLAALFALARVLRRAPAGLLNALFWIGLAKLALPLPLLRETLGGAVDGLVRTAASTGVAARGTLPLIESTAAVMNAPGPVLWAGHQSAGGLPLALTVVWAAGVLAMLVLWGRQARGSRSATAVSDVPPELSGRLAEVLAGVDVPASVVVVTDSPTVPHVTGILAPRIVLPHALLTTADVATLRSVLLHEDAHRRRREPLRLLLSRAAAVVFFFYPLVWPLLRRLRETGEMTCDDAVLARGVRPDAYARALAAIVNMELMPAPSSAALDRRSPSLMRRRLSRLNEQRRCTMKLGHRVAVLLAVVCVMMASVLSLTSLAGDPSTDAEAPDPPQKPVPAAAPEPEAAPLPEEFYLKDMTSPEYPEEAKAAGVEAIVFLELSIDEERHVSAATLKTIIVGRPPLEIIKVGKDGKVVEPVEEEGMEIYHEAFTEAAIEAAMKWLIEVRPENARFENPAVVVPIQFRLDGEKKTEAEG